MIQGTECGHGPACGPSLGRDLLWNVVLAFYFSHNYRLQEIRGFLILRFRNHPGLTGHFSSSGCWLLCPPSVPGAWLGTRRGGWLSFWGRGEGVRFLCMESYVYLGREMPVATWAYVFGWCSYTPEPMLLETCVMACGLGGRVARTLGGQALAELWLWRPTTSVQIPAPSLTGCAAVIKSRLLSEPPHSQYQRE